MLLLFLDFETRSKVDLKKRGIDNYFADPSTEIIYMSYSYSDSEKVFTLDANQIKKGVKFREFDFIVSHNYLFEWYCCQMLFKIEKDKFICTLATARRLGLSNVSLGELSKTFDLKIKKAGFGKGLIEKYCKPDKHGNFREITKDDNLLFRQYSRDDILALKELYYLLPKLQEDKYEYPNYLLDQKINSKGILIDTKSVKILKEKYDTLIDATEIAAVKYGKEKSGTLTISSNVGLKNLLEKKLKKKLLNVQDTTLNKILLMPVSDEIKEIINFRKIIQGKAAKKLDAFLNFPLNSIYYNSLNYYGAFTGRWTGYGIQIHNMPRIATKNFEKDLESEKINFASMIRGLIIPRKNKIFLGGDFSSIELVLCAWYANCQRILDSRRRGENVYINFGQDLYGRKLDKKKNEREYNLSKQGVLSAQYGTGKDRFLVTCENNGQYITIEESERTIKQFRKSFFEIPILWQNLEKTFIDALVHKGEIIKFGKLFFNYSGQALRLTLPSGRVLYYFRPTLQNGKIHINGHPIWGGDITAHVVSATARDLLCIAYQECERQELNPIFSVHDEIINEIDIKTKEKSIEKFKKIMLKKPDWLDADFPLDAEIGFLKRYGKL